MNQNAYPKIFTHRNDHKSQVVIANAEQEAQLPPEYLPEVVGVSGQTISAADNAAVVLSPDHEALLAEREKLEQDRATFAQLVADAQKDHADQQQALADERAKLTAGYKESMAQLEADRVAWEASKYAQASEGTTDTASAPSAVADAPAPAATPAKRVRTAKAE